jgi:hypothetical protein
MKRLYQGLNRRLAKTRGEKGGKFGEGKDLLPFELYHAICIWLVVDELKECIFAHCFLTLTWNLMCRSKNMLYINQRHLSWSSNTMAVNFAHTKSSMEGLDAGHKWHIYAKPKIAKICAVLSTGRYLAAFPAKSADYLAASASKTGFVSCSNQFLKNTRNKSCGWASILILLACTQSKKEQQPTAVPKLQGGRPMLQFATEQDGHLV